MAPFFWGLALGCLIALAISAALGLLIYRRMLRLQERYKQAERLAELGTFTGGLAHEIKNPLSTVQLNLQLLQEDLVPNNPHYSRLANRLALCQRETARLRDILDDFLRYAGRIELDRKPVELNSLCEDLVDFLYPQAQQQKVQVRLKRFPEPLVLQADERLLKQALMNLMLNGIQAMPNGGELIVCVSRTPHQALLEVIDTGTGIAPDQLEKIFHAYHTTKKSGTGLGLAMTQRIAQEHGGCVHVTSELGKGSDFCLRLPLNG